MIELDTKQDRLDILVRKFFEIIDTYYIDWQADEIKELILGYIAEQPRIDERQQVSFSFRERSDNLPPIVK